MSTHAALVEALKALEAVDGPIVTLLGNITPDSESPGARVRSAIAAIRAALAQAETAQPVAWKCDRCGNTSDCQGALPGDNWCNSCGACNTMRPLVFAAPQPAEAAQPVAGPIIAARYRNSPTGRWTYTDHDIGSIEADGWREVTYLCDANAAPQPAEAGPATKAERVHALVNAGPYPGMSEEFDAHMGAACWTDPAYRQDAATWAAAWKAARSAAEAGPKHEKGVREVLARWIAEACGVLFSVEEDAEDGGEGLRMLRESGLRLVRAVLNPRPGEIAPWLEDEMPPATHRADAEHPSLMSLQAVCQYASGALAEAAPKQEAVALPSPGSPEASAMIDSLLAEYGWPANPKNAARAGYEAARRLAAQPQQPAPEPVARGWS